MSKGNLFLGFGRGKVGDVVFSRLNGEQVTRARNRAPRNPRTPLQLLQRVLLKSASLAYSSLQDITNHAFQGFAEGTECQSRFIRLNIDRQRNDLSAIINSGDPEEILYGTDANYSAKTDSLPAIQPWIISEGTLSPLYYVPVRVMDTYYVPGFSARSGLFVQVAGATPSYAEVCQFLGVQQGDQVTLMWLSADDTQDGGVFNGFEYARIVMVPSTGDMTAPFIDSSTGRVNLPNEKNAGAVGRIQAFIENTTDFMGLVINPPSFNTVAGASNTLSGFAAIVSRQVGDVWSRSTQSMLLRSFTVAGEWQWTHDHSTGYIGDAVQSYMTDTSSLLYLNQAE